jgi:hypothetical protein
MKLRDLLSRYPGSCAAYLHLVDTGNTDAVIALPEAFRLQAGAALTEDVNGLFGYKVFHTECMPVKTSPGNGNGRNHFHRKRKNGNL